MRFLSTLAASVIGTLVALGLVVFFFVFFFFAMALSTDQAPTVEPGSVLAVPLEGEIPERVSDDPFQQAFASGSSIDLRDIQTSLRKATTDSRVDAVWLQLRGVSAGWATLEEVRQSVVEARREGLPVIASSEEFGMTEKGYYLASAADSVFTAPQSAFEYNGFVTILSFFGTTLERLEIEPEIVRAGKYKSAVEPFTRTDMSEPNRQQVTALLETVNNEFLTTIAEARNMSVEALDRLARDDAFLDASRAVEEGLIDGLRYEDGVRDILRDLSDQSMGSDLSTVTPKTYRRVSSSDAGISFTGTGQVDIVYGQGQIVTGDPGESLFGTTQLLGSTPMIEALEEARTNSSTEAVVLRINSPGGSAAASEAIWHAVERTAEEKPVIVSMGDVAASGGYYIAAPADSIVADPTTTTGSIGVFGLLVNAEGMFNEKLGVTFDGVNTSPYADLYSPTKGMSPTERRLMGRSIDRVYETFLQRVADGRRMDTSAVHDVAQGRVWSGEDAVDVGLVDTTGTLVDAVAMAGAQAGLGDGPYRTRVLPRPKTFFDRFAEQFASQAAGVWRSVTTNDLERKLWRQKQMLDRIVGTHGTIQARLPVRPEIE